MATRNIEAIEHKRGVYIRLDDLQAYLVSLERAADGATGKQVLGHILEQVEAIKEGRPV